jgi:hypothetical protein
MVGYSGTPLPKKLGIKEGHRVAVVNGPKGFEETLGDVPDGVLVQTDTAGKERFDVLILFVTRRAELERKLGALRKRMTSAAGLWIAWPKRASKVPTDMTEDVVRDVALPTGLVDNKVCAIDETWSGLRLVIRLEHREK